MYIISVTNICNKNVTYKNVTYKNVTYKVVRRLFDRVKEKENVCAYSTPSCFIIIFGMSVLSITPEKSSAPGPIA
jgi:hypothetical protein